MKRYAYHHGYYDGTEREFRGFGMVEQRDTEELGTLSTSGAFPAATNIDAASYVPPVLTKTWYHTGAYPMGKRVTRIYDEEYWSEPGLTPAEADAVLLSDSSLDPTLTGEEIREALRSLKGAMLRQEVYALDGTAAQSLPYLVSERNYTVTLLQPFGNNRHTVFLTTARESLDRHYERTLYDVSGSEVADPRMAHSLVLEVDEYGNELKSAAIAYGRRYSDPDPLLTPADQAIQASTLITYTESTYTNPIDEDDAYRTGLKAAVRTYQLTGYTPTGTAGRFQNTDFVQSTASGLTLVYDSEIPYEAEPTGGRQRRLFRQTRLLYRADDLSGALALGTVQSMALPWASYQLAFTSGILAGYQRGAEVLLPTPATVLAGEAGYASGDAQVTAGLFPATDAAGNWWATGSQLFYSPGSGDTAAQELVNARAHFFLPDRFVDPFGNTTTVTYDAYDLLNAQVQDPVGNIVAASNDYRVLLPDLITDPNGNRSAAAFDALGLVTGTAVMGKTTETLGDSLSGFVADLTQAQIDQFFTDPQGPKAATLLADATARMVYDVGRFARVPSTASAPLPVYAATIARETHVGDLTAAQPTSKLQIGFGYSDGFGRVIQKTGQAESGPLTLGGTPVNPRWIVSGWTIFNNKAKPVRQYEPFFAATHDFQFAVMVGVSPVLFYDPLARVVATLDANQTWGRVVFDPWRQITWDANDTVLISDPGTDADVGQYFQRLPTSDYMPSWYTQRIGGALGPGEQDAAQKAAAHASTPTTVQCDSLGRVFLTLAFNRYVSGGSAVESHDRTLIALDVEGNQRSVTDSLERQIMTYDFGLLKTRIQSSSVDAGQRWMLNDVAGKALLAWDSRDFRIRRTYDALQRPVGLFVQSGAGPEAQVELAVYGEGQPNDQLLNLRGKLYQQFDGAGVVNHTQFDFKGNLLSSGRQLILNQDFTQVVDWSKTYSLDTAFTSNTSYDALNRPISLTAPDGSVLTPKYNMTGLLQTLNGNLTTPGRPSASVAFVTDIDYDAKAQRQSIDYGNGVSTAYTYDPLTFRLVALYTARPSASFPGDDPTPPNPPRGVQNLSYSYDPVGNVTQIEDEAQQTIYFNNARVPPLMRYTHDALYQLIQATGREAIGQVSQPQTTYDDGPRMNLPLPNDWTALRNYTEAYQYDVAGNVLTLAHTASGGNWTRTYAYGPAMPPANNQLTSTTANGSTDSYSYDGNGNLLTMPQFASMSWDFKNQLQATQTQVVTDGTGPRTFYIYDAAGQRVRKVTESANGAVSYERIYLGSFEVYREYGGTGVMTLERQTLHVMDDRQRIALVENLTQGSDGSPSQLVRYQFSNHLGSACLELDEGAQVISYEEYYPYGSTAYQACNQSIKASAKRYRFTGKERDEETGFYYHGARYYAPWLGRWTACDPAGIAAGMNLYAYGRDNPVRFTDRTGLADDDPVPDLTALAKSDYGTAGARGPTGGGLTALGNAPLPEPSLTGPTVTPGAPAPPSAAHATAPAAPRAALTDEQSLHNLKSYMELTLPKLQYPQTLTQAMGAVQMVGGGLELLTAVGTTETGVGPVLLGAHGMDMLQTGARTAWTGEQQRSFTFYAGSGASFIVSDDAQLASAVGSSWDMAAGIGAGAYSLKLIPAPVIAPETVESGLVSQTLDNAQYLKQLGSTDPETMIQKGNQVLAGIEDRVTGQRFFGRSGQDVADPLHPALKPEYEPWKGLIDEDPNYAKLGPAGAHGEVNALNRALWARDPTGTVLTPADLGQFDMTAVWLGKEGPYVMPRCPTCWFMTPGVNFLGTYGVRF